MPGLSARLPDVDGPGALLQQPFELRILVAVIAVIDE
jgi:hypothetical protein